MQVKIALTVCLLTMLGTDTACESHETGASKSDAGSSMLKTIEVTAALTHSCALANDGTVRCWGFNSSGQTSGDGSRGNPFPTAVTVVAGLSHITQLSAGGAHTCALSEDGSVHCWGDSGEGESAGDAMATNVTAVVTVKDLKDVIQVSAGYYHTCALVKAGSVRCWGRNASAEITGDGQATEGHDDRIAVTTVAGLSHVIQIAAGVEHNCALIDDGSVRCWGDNQYAQSTDDGVPSDPVAVTTIAGLSHVTQVIASRVHSCALIDDGSVSCWGAQDPNRAAGPLTAMSEVSGVKRLAYGASGSQTCALMNDGSVDCWGSNVMAEASGDGMSSQESQPVTAVVGLTAVQQVATGEGHTCALLDDGSVRCWGDDVYGQSTGRSMTTDMPVAVSAVVGL